MLLVCSISSYLWTHKRFDIGVHGNQIVDVNLTTGKRTKLEPGATIRFTYQINWKQSDVPFSKRYEKYVPCNVPRNAAPRGAWRVAGIELLALLAPRPLCQRPHNNRKCERGPRGAW